MSNKLPHYKTDNHYNYLIIYDYDLSLILFFGGAWRMNSELKKNTEKWKGLERKTLEQRRVADEFYDKNLMKLIEEDFVERNEDMIFEKIEYMIISVGTSYEPIVLSLSLLNPEKVLFLYTEKSEIILSKIIAYKELSPDKYEKSLVNEVDPLDIYKEIKKIYIKWNRPEKMYIDFTGGTKAMSATAALAGAMIDVQLIYIGSDDYLVDFRKPNPGSENLIYIDNPIAVFGDMEIDKAFELLDKYNFSGAIEKLETLKENIPEPDTRQQLNFVYLLAKSYEGWDALDFRRAYEYMDILKIQLERDVRTHRRFLLMDFLDDIRIQREILENLQCIPGLINNKKNMEILKQVKLIHPLMFTMYQNAKIREYQDKYDMATLLFYRLLEMIEQRRLARYNLYVSNADYSAISINTKRCPETINMSGHEKAEWLRQEVNKIKTELFKKENTGYLQEQISLLEGFIILKALKDPLVKDINYLKKMRSMVYLRNNSIFAHGLGPVAKHDYIKFRDFVIDSFKHFCEIERISFDERAKQVNYLNPMKSKYYSASK